MQVVLSGLQSEALLWAQAVRARQRSLFKHFRDEDWSKGGGWHASVLKPPTAQPLTAFCEAESLDVRPLRSVKGRDASFMLVSGDPPIPGSIWDFGTTRALVTQCSDSVVRLNLLFRSDMSVKKVL